MIGLIQNINLESHKALPLTASVFTKSDMGISQDDGKGNGPKSYPFDLFVDESHGLEFQLSEHPVQDGSVITDHVTQKLRSCTISGMFTNHSVRRNRNNTDVIKIDGYESNEVRTNEALENYEALETLAKKRQPVRLVTSLVTYPEMIIKSIKVQRGPDDGESIKFKMVLTEFKRVNILEISADYIYKPESMEKDIDRMIASPANNGVVSAVQVKAVQMIRTLGVQ